MSLILTLKIAIFRFIQLMPQFSIDVDRLWAWIHTRKGVLAHLIWRFYSLDLSLKDFSPNPTHFHSCDQAIWIFLFLFLAMYLIQWDIQMVVFLSIKHIRCSLVTINHFKGHMANYSILLARCNLACRKVSFAHPLLQFPIWLPTQNQWF